MKNKVREWLTGASKKEKDIAAKRAGMSVHSLHMAAERVDRTGGLGLTAAIKIEKGMKLPRTMTCKECRRCPHVSDDLC